MKVYVCVCVYVYVSVHACVSVVHDCNTTTLWSSFLVLKTCLSSSKFFTANLLLRK